MQREYMGQDLKDAVVFMLSGGDDESEFRVVE